MSVFYLDEDKNNINDDIIYRKEFQLYKKNLEVLDNVNKLKKNDSDKNIIPRYILDKLLKKNNYLSLQSPQLFIKNYFNPNTPYTRLLLKWDVGLGKTVAAISIALNFINYYQKEEVFNESNVELGSVFIIGFTKRIFIEEMLKFPELGFLSRDEYKKYNMLRQKSYSGNPVDVESFKKMSLVLRKRLYNRKGNGFFKFIGYKELSNHLFIKKDKNINIHSLSDEALENEIKKGNLVLNKEMLMSFKNSLLICDEIHNVYNSLEKNNWGTSIQVILNAHESTRALFLSATPLNNSPTEVIDLLNLLLPRKFYQPLKKKDYFDANNNIIDSKLNTIKNLIGGRISFIRDSNPEYYASKEVIGEKLPGFNEDIKFIRCPMSTFHYNTYKSIINTEKNTLSQENQYIVDFALPDPSVKVADAFKTKGLFNTNEIKSKLSNVYSKWKAKYGIEFHQKEGIITGNILEKNTIKTISNKYYTMITRLLEKIKNKKGKTFIFHNYIHMSGTLFIKEILLNNGIIGEYDTSRADTICTVCGDIRKNHTKEQLLNVVGGGLSEISERSDPLDDMNITVYKQVDNQDIEIFQYMQFENYKFVLVCSINESYMNDVKNYITGKNIILHHEPIEYTGGWIFGENDEDQKKDQNDEDQNEEDQKKEKNDENKIIKCNPLMDISDGFDLLHKDNEFNNSKFYFSKLNKLDIDDRIDLVRKYYNEIKLRRGLILGGKNKKSTHFFQPVRFVIVHSNLDVKKITQSLEKFNSINNIHGNKYMIMISSKIMKESYSMNSVKNLMVMSRPDNIPMLIQIIGRVVRLKSHNLLPMEERHVEIELYTTCLPIKKNQKFELGYEEIKYIKKIKTYKIIQKIEKIMHENAIDASFNYDTIWQSDGDDSVLNILPYSIDKKHSNKSFKLNELNLSSFNAYYMKDEILYTMYIIKRLFVEISYLWKYDDLYRAVQNPPFLVEIDTKLISKKSLNIAITNILFHDKLSNFIEPKIQKNNDNFLETDLIDILHNPIDKFFYINGMEYVIIHYYDYYILTQINSNMEALLDIESIYRSNLNKRQISVDVNNYLKYDLVSNYDNKKIRFYNKWKDVSITNLEQSICDFGISFHENLIKECVEYIFKVWTDPSVKKSEYHAFYLKFLYYYDLQRIIVWGHTVNDTLAKSYSKYLIPVKTKLLKNTKLNKKINEKNLAKSSGLMNLLKTSINRSGANWISTGMVNEFNEKLDMTLKLFDGISKKNKVSKVNADLVPVGHFLNKIPQFYVPDLGGWINDPTYREYSKFIKENPLVVGMDTRSETGISVFFKVRNPIQNIKQHSDTRNIEKGSVCSTKSKTYLKYISKKLDIDLGEKINVEDLCSKIRTKLIYLELKEQIQADKDKNYKKLRYFYFVYQSPPETITR